MLSALGETVQLTATVLDQNGQAMSGVSVTWASSDGGVASVGANGVVTAVQNGSATVTATSRDRFRHRVRDDIAAGCAGRRLP